MAKEDDVIPDNYSYQWCPKSETPLQDFLAKYKPSMVQNDGTKPWLWVHKTDGPSGTPDKFEEAVVEASTLLSDVTERVKQIQDDSAIPIRSNKKKGLKSKKEMREEVQHEATEKLKDISQKHGAVIGKWLVFAPPDRVDAMWHAIATSLISGPLSATSAYLAKVATSAQSETPNYSHLVCVYVPDVYDQVGVTEVMKVLLRNHGLNLMGVKSNLYTSIGIDSKHPSGVPSTVWKNTALMKDTEIKELKNEYFAELNAAKAVAAEEVAAKKEAADGTKKAKPKLKKKTNDNPFASEGEDENSDAKAVGGAPPAASGSKGKKAVPKKKAPVQEFASDEDDEGTKPPSKKARPKKAPPKRRKDSNSDGSEDDVPKKKSKV
ncbi:translation initiation factor eIF 4e-like domain-containing protein [Trametes meyenii]|nr:translation initiation factor eIF 4e-like domain-containing protein [Trametes meyenii]